MGIRKASKGCMNKGAITMGYRVEGSHWATSERMCKTQHRIIPLRSKESGVLIHCSPFMVKDCFLKLQLPASCVSLDTPALRNSP